MNLDLNALISPVRPLLSAAGTIIIAAGLLKFFGVNIPISGGGLELAVAGWLMKGL
jgi:hypothetical protein